VSDTDTSLPTPRSTLRSRYARVLVWCKACRHQREADLQALADAGRGDVPLIKLRFRCSNCGSRLTDWVVTARKTEPSGALGGKTALNKGAGPSEPPEPQRRGR
jgi:hypothetical protein